MSASKAGGNVQDGLETAGETVPAESEEAEVAPAPRGRKATRAPQTAGSTIRDRSTTLSPLKANKRFMDSIPISVTGGRVTRSAPTTTVKFSEDVIQGIHL